MRVVLFFLAVTGLVVAHSAAASGTGCGLARSEASQRPIVVAAGGHPGPISAKKHRKSLLGHAFHSLSHGHGKAVIVGVSTLLVFLEVFEEIALELPVVKELVGHKLASVHHGVFLLTLSHLVTTIAEVVKSIEESVESRHHLKVEELIHKLRHQTFSNERDAAAAYDRVALAAFGRGAALNLPFSVFGSHIPLDGEGKPVKTSKVYRGVVQGPGSLFKVDTAAFVGPE